MSKHKRYFSISGTGSVRGEDGRCGFGRRDRCVYHCFNLDSDSRARHRSVARNRPNKVRAYVYVFDTEFPSPVLCSVVSWIISMLFPHQVRDHPYISSGAHHHTGFSLFPSRTWSSLPCESSSSECIVSHTQTDQPLYWVHLACNGLDPHLPSELP